MGTLYLNGVPSTYLPLSGGTDGIMTGNLLATDDTYYLGDATHGWKGLHMPATLIRDETGQVDFRNNADSAWVGIGCSDISPTGNLYFQSDASSIRARNLDSYTLIGEARDNGVGPVEIWRMVGAADPHLRIGRDDTGVGLSSVTDHQAWQAGGGTGNEAAGFGYGLSIRLGNAASEVEERASWDTVLATATNGSEDSRYDWSLMTAGAMNLAMQLTGVGVLSVDLAGVGTAAQVDLFDDYDDALVLQQTIQQHNREKLVEMGIASHKDSGSGYMLHVQPMLRLLAGGIYQTRERLDALLARTESLELENKNLRNRGLALSGG